MPNEFSQEVKETTFVEKPKTSWLAILLSIIITALIVGGVVYALQTISANKKIENLENQIENLQKQISQENNENDDAEIVELNCGQDNKFISEQLGIAFCYPGKYGDNNIAVKQKDSKVYVYWGGTAFEEGQWVEVFNKNANDSLKTAIEKQFNLSGYKDCYVKEYSEENNVSKATLNYPVNNSTDGPWFEFSGVYCPEGYDVTNGIRYFYTKESVSKFLFFSIGQYAIPLMDGRLWQDTIKILK